MAQQSGQQVKRVTTKTVMAMKKEGNKIACLTAYDYVTAKLLDQAGVEIVLVGDSLAMVFQGEETTLPVTLEDMLYHAKAVVRGVRRALVIVDMPFMTYQGNPEEGFRNAGRIMKETGAGGVKVEGGERVAEMIRMTAQAGIPVMGHLGLTPQSIHSFGGYQPRGATKEEARRIIAEARVLEEAGVFSIVLEKIPATLAAKVTQSVSIPTIGIGAGIHTDGQILVVSDMLGLYEDFHPRFVRRYANLAEEIRSSVGKYVSDIKSKKFPSKDESYTSLVSRK
ncbi:MAG: 3-methyl-2-oxobutanoate hydroxymethyltransferase [Ignavibacteriales bacterium]|nr:3-methyl-2-oxobutanoate hydroxymethyltransferase [Ignavibacteriales bacterium]